MSENANWHVPPARATGAKDVSIPARGCHGAFILGPAGEIVFWGSGKRSPGSVGQRETPCPERKGRMPARCPCWVFRQ